MPPTGGRAGGQGRRTQQACLPLRAVVQRTSNKLFACFRNTDSRVQIFVIIGSSDPNTVFGPTNCKLENPTLTQWRQGRTRWWGFGVPGPRLGCERLSVADGEECSVVVDGASAEDVTTVRIERNLGVTTGTVSRGPRVTIVDSKNPLGLAAICDLLLIDWPYQGILTARSTTNCN